MLQKRVKTTADTIRKEFKYLNYRSIENLHTELTLPIGGSFLPLSLIEGGGRKGESTHLELVKTTEKMHFWDFFYILKYIQIWEVTWASYPLDHTIHVKNTE